MLIVWEHQQHLCLFLHVIISYFILLPADNETKLCAAISRIKKIKRLEKEAENEAEKEAEKKRGFFPARNLLTNEINLNLNLNSVFFLCWLVENEISLLDKEQQCSYYPL